MTSPTQRRPRIEASARPVRQRGFTLIEVVVALVVMGVMTVMAWRAVSALTGSRDHNEAAMLRTETLQTLVRQWELDLREVQDSTLVPALAFDGATLRLTRRRENGLQLVTWQLRDGRLSRWESPPATGRDGLQDAWFRSQQLSAEELRQLPGLPGVIGWQMYFFRGNGWSNAQSSDDVAPQEGNPDPGSNPGPNSGDKSGTGSGAGPYRGPNPQTGGQDGGGPRRVVLPSGVRMRLQFGPDSGYRGELIREVPVEASAT